VQPINIAEAAQGTDQLEEMRAMDKVDVITNHVRAMALPVSVLAWDWALMLRVESPAAGLWWTKRY
jgi:hypothetical protein